MNIPIKLKKPALIVSLVLLPLTHGLAADITVVNLDPENVGFNDTTLVEPVGGNDGTTLGQQRLNVFTRAAEIWGNRLQSDVPIRVGAMFSPLECEASSGVLGAAGPTFVFNDFPGAQLESTFYVSALADALAGEDLLPGEIDIIAFFNGDIGVNPDCLTGQDWYNGFDHNNDPTSEFDLLTVVTHEISHGLGFLELVDEQTGELFLDLPDTYTANMFDADLGQLWTDLNNEERLASQVNTDDLVWAGGSVSAAAPAVLGPRPSANFFGSGSLRGSVEVQIASFGAQLRARGVNVGRLTLADDGVEPTTDGCEPLTQRLRRRIVLIDRGGCSFVEKAANAQAAGARGVVIANNLPSGRPPLGGADPDIVIPTVGITMEQGEALAEDLARFPGIVFVRLFLDRSIKAGINEATGFVRLFAPDPVQPGSSKSHFDTTATPNLLMEPSINDDLAPSRSLDLTPALLEDIGWQLQ